MKRYITLWLSLCIVAVLLAATALSPALAEDAAPAANPYLNISCTYPVDNTSHRCDFIYSDDMLLGDARDFSTDLAKASVALMSAVYGTSISNIQGVLERMSYTVVAGGDSYAKRTIASCDFVAFAIGRKTITAPDGTVYTAYCVPIRGSHGADWFSNFLHLGDGTNYHEGFHTAAMRVYTELRRVMLSSDDGAADADHRIIWICGHSRAAAVGNIIEGILSEEGTYATPEHIFGYNIACPALAKEYDTSLTNIHNINNSSDPVPRFPLASWGYSRNGRTETLNAHADSVFQAHFTSLTGSDYATDPDAVSALMRVLTHLVDSEDAYHKPATQLVLTAAAYIMGGKKEVTKQEVLDYPGTKAIIRDLILQGFCEKTAKKLLDTALNTVIPGSAKVVDTLVSVCEQLVNVLTTEDSQFDAWIDFLDESMSATKDMEEEAFQQYLSDNRTTFSAITNATGIEIRTRDDMRNAMMAMNDGIDASASVLGDAQYAITHLSSLLSVGNGHIQDTYVTAFNAKWCGYQGQKGIATGSFTIPSDITTIGPECFAGCGELETVEIPESVVTIGNKAFNSSSILSIQLPDGMRYIGEYAFQDCTTMQSVMIPDSVETIGDRAFLDCYNVNNIIMPIDLSHNDGVFSGCCNVTTIVYSIGHTGVMDDRGTNKDSYTIEFFSRNSLERVVFRDGVTYIGEDYTRPLKLKSVIFPKTLRKIGNYAFYNQTDIAGHIDISTSLEELGKYCFFNCKNISGVKLSEKITNIPEHCFSGCNGITELDIPSSVTSIDKYAFEKCSIASIIIPASITSIGYNAFGDCKNLRDIRMPVELADTSAFSNCTSVTNITYYKAGNGIMPDRGSGSSQVVERQTKENLHIVFNEGITRIAEFAFWNEWSDHALVSDIIFPSTLKSIGRHAFNGQSLLTGCLVLPEGLTELGEYCFSKCTGLTRVIIPCTLENLGRDCFSACSNLTDIEIHGAPTIYNTLLWECNNAVNIRFSSSAPNFQRSAFYDVTATAYYPAYDPTWTESVRQNYGGHITWVGVKLALDREELMLAALDLGFGDVTQLTCAAPEGYDLADLDGLTWSSDAPAVATVEDGLVRGLSAGTAVISAKVGTLEGRCTVTVRDDLSVLQLPAGLTEIGPEAFSGLASVEAVVLPEGVTRIGASAFAGCSGLLMINIPDTVTDIAPDAFDDCPQVCLYCDPESPAASLDLRWELLP